MNKLVEMRAKVEEQAKRSLRLRRKSGESDELSAQVRPWQYCGRKLLHLELFENAWWARQETNL